MKILHIGLNFEYNKTMIKALKSLGEYYSIEWTKEIKINGIVSLTTHIINTVKHYRPNLIFVQAQRAGIITPKMIENILKIIPDVKIFNWTGDVRIIFDPWYIDVAKISDNVYTGFSDAESVNILKSEGIKNVNHVQIGFEETIMNCQPNKRLGNDIVFLSNYYQHMPLAKLKKNVVDVLRENYGNKFTPFGKGWGDDSFIVHMNIAPSIYKGSKIAIGINNIANYHYTSDRLFNAMASGVFYLAHYYEGIENDFENKKHLVWWKTIDELDEQINYYLLHQDERKYIAYQGYNEVWNKHRWINRIQQIKGIIYNESL